MKKSNLKATSLRTAMGVVVVVIILISIIGFYFAQDWIGKFATQADQTASGSSIANSNSLQALTNLRNEVVKNQANGDKANSMIASSQNYQNQIIKDINKYAADTGITIAGQNFTQSDANGTNTLVAITGLSPKFVTITLGNPVPLKNLLQFFRAIENNLPKMQIMGINLTPSSTSSDSVTSDPITIGVYTR